MDSKEKILTSTFADAIDLAKKELYRDMPWRRPDFDEYKILVSEIMLQQTQVNRVVGAFTSFTGVYPTIHDLADAPLAEVLRLWSGLGYNRRAKYLHEAAKQLKDIATPWSYNDLIACKGIGPNTAKAVLVYTYNLPEIFIETNIRTVVLNYFYKKSEHTISDAEITLTMASVIDTAHPREWYWAIMDLGSYLKQTNNAQLHKAKSYKKQATFKGSLRQVRGQVIKLLGEHTNLSVDELQNYIQDAHLNAALASLRGDGLITLDNDSYYLGTGS